MFLISSFSLIPDGTSEPGAGWSVVKTYARLGKATVLVDTEYKPFFSETTLDTLNKQGINIVFRGIDNLRLLYKLPLKTLWHNVYYKIWQYKSRKWLRDLASTGEYKIGIHATWGKGTIIPGIAYCGLPYVLGPIGAFEPGVKQLDKYLDLTGRVMESLRRYTIKRSLNSQKLKQAYANAELVIATTDYSAKIIKEFGAKNIKVASNAGIEAKEANIIDEMRMRQTPNTIPVILFNGRLQGWKGEMLVLSVMSKLMDLPWKLIIKGNGPNLSKCKEFVMENGMNERVEFIGFLEKSDYYRLLVGCDYLFFPSYHESGGIVVAEAMAAGLKVLTLDVGGPATLLGNTALYTADTTKSCDEIINSFINVLKSEIENFTNQDDQFVMKCKTRLDEFVTWEARDNNTEAIITSTLNVFNKSHTIAR